MNNKMINLTIDDVDVSVQQGSTVLQAAFAVGIKIPTLCYLAGVNEIGACRMCVVEVEGARSLVAACVYPVSEGMVVHTASEKVLKSRRNTLELLLSNHRCECLTCERDQNCELQRLAVEFGIELVKYKSDNLKPQPDYSAVHLIRDNSKCILCGRCTSVCKNNQEVAVIGAANRGFNSLVESPFGRGLGEVNCIHCGQCVTTCPTGAIVLNKQIKQVEDAIKDPSKKVVAMPAPAVRVGLGDEFGMKPGVNTELKMATALRRIGFDYVFDVNWGADLTILEEGTELLGRIKNEENLPMFTSCCPGWVEYMEYNHPDMLDNLSSCKSPLEMQGGIIKTYFAKKQGIDPKDLVVVSVMPCTAKKFEISREDHAVDGMQPSDYSITTRELAMMIKERGMIFDKLPDSEYDTVLAEYTGAGVIFGSSGGVMEAALRTAVSKIVGSDDLAPLEYKEVRGHKGIKEATYSAGDLDINVCVASGLANAEKVIQMIKSGEKKYDFVEVMACPGGCVNGGGQPIKSAFEKEMEGLVGNRSKGLYNIDKNLENRRSHLNESVKKVYDDFLVEPNSEKAHHILHTQYQMRKKYNV